MHGSATVVSALLLGLSIGSPKLTLYQLSYGFEDVLIAVGQRTRLSPNVELRVSTARSDPGRDSLTNGEQL